MHAELLVATASDLAPAHADLAASFQKLSGESLKFVTGASGVLARQVENGAPYDVYLSANKSYVAELAAARHIIPASVAVYARGRLGIWPASAQVSVIADLAKVQRVAIANPQHAPYGAAAKQSLERAGLWASIQSRIVMAENVRQALQYGESGNADAVITAWSLVKDKGGVLVPETQHDPIEQAGGIVASSKQAALAGRLMAFLKSAQGAALLERYGFQPVTGTKNRTPAVLESRYIAREFALSADPAARHWRRAPLVVTTSGRYGEPMPEARTEVRSLWTRDNLYFLFAGRFVSLFLKPDPSTTKETWGLWDYDVAEVFIGHDLKNISLYKEFEVSPQNEWVDLDVDRARKGKEVDWLWNSNFRFRSRIDRKAGIWYCEMQIPWKSIDTRKPAAGNELRLNLYRIEGGPEKRKYIAWQPVNAPSFHTPEAFGRLRLAK
ncbi:MAG: molybdate ABC transporter substrate-binding protein [Bryobacteraceae bacterium]|nr:molybdate ABC transporter substrate-binding protein [Bryobacteraceae bacterium]